MVNSQYEWVVCSNGYFIVLVEGLDEHMIALATPGYF
jgi:hypothetical protein